jgi:hypothetical protein
MIASKKSTHRRSGRKTIQCKRAGEPRGRPKTMRSRRRQLRMVQDAMLHNWLLEEDDCG